MSIQSAIDLIKRIDKDVDLRMEMYVCNTPYELNECLTKNGFWFTLDELEEATNSLHVKCQSIYEADELLHKVEWIKIMLLTA